MYFFTSPGRFFSSSSPLQDVFSRNVPPSLISWIMSYFWMYVWAWQARKSAALIRYVDRIGLLENRRWLFVMP